MSHPNPSTALAVTVLDELVRLGLSTIVVAPGSRSAALAIEAARRSDVEVVVEIDERSAGFLALGAAKVTARPAAVVVTSGTAVANLLPAVVEADASATPLVLLTADRPPELIDVGANQTIAQDRIFGDFVRWRATVGPAEDRSGVGATWRSVVDRAVAESLGWSSEPGPVHLNLAFREPLVPRVDDGRVESKPFHTDVSGRTNGRPWTRPVIPSAPVAPLDPEWAGIERGLVVAGTGRPGPVVGHADRLAAALGWPLVAEPAAGGRPAQTITTAHHLSTIPRFAERFRPDVVLTVGKVGLSRPLAGMIAGVPTVATGGWNDVTRRAVAVYPGLVAVDGPHTRESRWRRSWLECESIGRAALDAAIDRIDVVTEARAARDLAAVVPDGGVIVAGSSTPIRDLDRYLPTGRFDIVANRGASGIDGLVSTAFGVGRHRPTVALLGDLTLLHDSSGLSVRPRPDSVLVVLDNDGGGIFSYLPQAGETDVFETVFGTPAGVDIAALAASHGIEVRSVERPDGIRSAIESMSTGNGGIVHLRVARGPQVEIAEMLTAAAADAVEAALG